MYGLLSKLLVLEGKRDPVIKILIDGTSKLPGCLCYIVSKDMIDQNAIWITEVWDNKNDHDDSLSLQSVQDSIASARPFISGFGERHEVEPAGGYGIAK